MQGVFLIMIKNKKIYIVLLVFIVLCIVMATLILKKEKEIKFKEENLIFECSKSTEENGILLTLSKKMYDNGKEIKQIYSDFNGDDNESYIVLYDGNEVFYE